MNCAVTEQKWRIKVLLWQLHSNNQPEERVSLFQYLPDFLKYSKKKLHICPSFSCLNLAILCEIEKSDGLSLRFRVSFFVKLNEFFKKEKAFFANVIWFDRL